MCAYIYITIWSRRDGAHLVLTISPVELREDIPVVMYSIAPAGIDSNGNNHYVGVEERKSLYEVSAKYVGAIFVGRSRGWASKMQAVLDWVTENGGANNATIPDWNNGQWVCSLVGSMSATEHELVDTVLPERLLRPAGLLQHIYSTHIPVLWRKPSWGNMIPLT